MWSGSDQERADDKMKIIGITGGVGSGKSQVLDYLKTQYGAVVCQLDETARDLQRKGQPCYKKIVEVFGREMLAEDGELNRERLAQTVFQDEKKLEILNEIVHPEVKRCVQQDILNKKKKEVPLYVIEAALLPVAGYEDICDEMWYIYTSEAVRRERLKASRGYTDKKITDMIKSQPEEDVFRKACGAVIDNSGAFDETKKQIGELLI